MRRVRPLFSDDLMKGNPALPGGPLKSKPTWLSTYGCLAASAFFRLRWGVRWPPPPETNALRRELHAAKDDCIC